MTKPTWIIGDIEIYQIVELRDAGKLIQEFIKQAAPENLKKIDWLYPNYIDNSGNMKSYVQSFLIKSENRNILIDTCNGNNKTRTDLPEWRNLDTNYLNEFYKAGIID